MPKDWYYISVLASSMTSLPASKISKSEKAEILCNHPETHSQRQTARSLQYRKTLLWTVSTLSYFGLVKRFHIYSKNLSSICKLCVMASNYCAGNKILSFTKEVLRTFQNIDENWINHLKEIFSLKFWALLQKITK